MGYTVEYNPELRKNYPVKKEKLSTFSAKPIIITVCVLVALFAAHKLGFLQWLIPGDPAVTTGAFSKMVDDVKAGQTVSDALFSFFRNVIGGAAS